MANGFRYIIEYNEINQKTRVSSDDEVLYEWKYGNEKPYYLLKHIDHVNHLEYDYKYDEQGEVSQVSCNNGTTYYTDNGVTEWAVKTTEEDKKEEETYQILGDDYIYKNGDIKASSNESAQNIYVDDENISTTKVICENDNEKQITQNGSMWHYVYDEQGLLKELQKDGELSCRYEYNNLNELVREDSALTGKTMLYQYDGGGNIQTVVSYPLDTVKAKEQFTGGAVESQYEYDKNFPDRLIAFQGKKITYDKMGNPLDYWNGYRFAWTQGQRLETICHGDNRYCYSYDMDGYRMSKTINGTKTCFTYQNGTLTMEKSVNHEMRYHYDAGNHLLYFEYNDKPYYYELDDYNTVVGILNEQGERLVSYEYDAWGKVLSISGDRRLGERNPFRYRSYYYDEESGFYYLHNRYYDPEVRRMLNMDSYTDTQFGMLSHNMYAYCENTPVNASNYSGNIPAWVKKLKKSPSGNNYLWKTNSVYTETNCYGYAVKYDKKRPIDPGHFTGKSFRFDRITDYTKADLKKKFNHFKQVTYEESNALPKKYIVIALRMGKSDTGGSDYHYMRRLYDSKSKTLIWTHKPGRNWGGVLIHKYWPAKLTKWPYEGYNISSGRWDYSKNAGYTGMIVYYAYWN